jgi:RNA polymerase sigma-70 factor, ECF subfamily
LNAQGDLGILIGESLGARRMQKDAQVAEQNEGPAHLTQEQAIVGREHPVSVENDALLAGRLRKGEQAAADDLVSRYYERIYLFMRAVGHNRQTSEDLTQETFLRAWYHIGQLRDGKALNGWLFRIAGNVSKLYHRRHKDRPTVDLDSVEPPAGGVDGSKRAGEHEQMSCLHEAVARLPWKLRQAIVLHYMEQLTISEAAEAAGIRPGTLKSRLNRGLEALRDEVADE